ncbi:MAG: HEAT repeat domain-containing protein [Planctomycetota bacterium]|nr:HEAT repeat domain-containing protein [Planctomycetota bacterium]
MSTVTTPPFEAKPFLTAILALCVLIAPIQASPSHSARPLSGLPTAQDADSRAALPPPESPPALTSAKIQKLGRSIKKLTSKKTKARLLAEEDILEFGRGAIPVLIEEAVTTSPYKQLSVQRCLIALADLRDWDLVEATLDSPQVALRRFAARKAGELQLEHLIERLIPLLEDEDSEVRLEAAVTLARLGSESSLGALAQAYTQIFRLEQDDEADQSDEAVESLLDAGVRIRACLPGLAEVGNHANLIARLKSDPKLEKTNPDEAALNRQSAIAMLLTIGDGAAIAGISRALDDTHNVVQRDAINALRELLEDQPPFSGGSIFQQINEVKRLKGVLAQSR